MYLKKLELSGFKSFAQKVSLEFPAGITAVVGPNGSGKSNIADALRFVMGEQSMKSIRSRSSADLIFSGSDKKPPMSRGYVNLYLDNKNKIFPIDFEELVVSRKISRDGSSEYSINDSPVRLKDVVDMLLRARLGLRGYTVINQGFGDSILTVSPKERREILDEAIGVREFQIKKEDSKNKLKETHENLEKISSLIAEISPHLKFLKKQAAKLEQQTAIKQELEELKSKYFIKKIHTIEQEISENSKLINEKLWFIEKIEKDLEELKNKAFKEEEGFNKYINNLGSIENKLDELMSKKLALERSLGGVEAKLEILDNVVETGAKEILKTKNILSEIKNIAEKALGGPIGENMVSALRNIINKINNAIDNEGENLKKNDDVRVERDRLLQFIKENDEEIIKIKNNLRLEREKNQKDRNEFIELRDSISKKENEVHNLKNAKEIILKNIDEKKEELSRVLAEAKESGLNEKNISEYAGNPDLSNENIDSLFAALEKQKIRLEVAESIDPEIQKEYEETNKRYQFLTEQSKDMLDSIKSLEEVISNLDLKIEEIFDKSFGEINKSFDKFFKVLFGGGGARLVVQKDNLSAKKLLKDEEGGVDDIMMSSRSAKEEKKQNNEDFLEERGIEIKVEVPKKKIKSLNMLSGGERALTSLSLLFALVAMAKPPFLVLDEIDAPLDESNAARFSKILIELSSNTQFILITHNRETMQNAGALYGVTMGEEGFSKLLSIKFDEETAEKYAR